jgi:hypothetical protein
MQTLFWSISISMISIFKVHDIDHWLFERDYSFLQLKLRK